MPSIGLLVLRLTLAVVLGAHGAHQLFGTFAGPGVGAGGLSLTAAYFEAAGIVPGFPAAVVSGFIQLLGGVLIGVGLLTRWAALATVAYLALMIWKDQSRWGFFLNWVLEPGRGHGFEQSVLLIGALVCLVVAGAGDWSIDGTRAKSAESRAAGRARLQRS